MIFKSVKEGVICLIKVVPNASRTALGEIVQINSDKDNNEFLKVYVKAPATEDKANNELLRFLSKIWNVKKSQFKIIKGASQAYKTVLIEGSSEILLKTVHLDNAINVKK